jgi:hypothetical protein
MKKIINKIVAFINKIKLSQIIMIMLLLVPVKLAYDNNSVIINENYSIYEWEGLETKTTSETKFFTNMCVLRITITFKITTNKDDPAYESLNRYYNFPTNYTLIDDHQCIGRKFGTLLHNGKDYKFITYRFRNNQSLIHIKNFIGENGIGTQDYWSFVNPNDLIG